MHAAVCNRTILSLAEMLPNETRASILNALIGASSLFAGRARTSSAAELSTPRRPSKRPTTASRALPVAVVSSPETSDNSVTTTAVSGDVPILGEPVSSPRAAKPATDSQNSSTPSATIPPEIVDWSDQIEKAMAHPHGLLGIWRQDILPVLSVPIGRVPVVTPRLRLTRSLA